MVRVDFTLLFQQMFVVYYNFKREITKQLSELWLSDYGAGLVGILGRLI